MEWSLEAPRLERWSLPKVDLHLDLFKGCTRFLRYPEPEQGIAYRAIRLGLIAALRVKGLVR